MFKNWICCNITKGLKLSFFQWGIKIVGPNFSYLMLKQLIFEAFKALQKWGILKKARSFCWFSSNSEVEAPWTSLIGWPHKTSTMYQNAPPNSNRIMAWHHLKSSHRFWVTLSYIFCSNLSISNLTFLSLSQKILI